MSVLAKILTAGVLGALLVHDVSRVTELPVAEWTMKHWIRGTNIGFLSILVLAVVLVPSRYFKHFLERGPRHRPLARSPHAESKRKVLMGVALVLGVMGFLLWSLARITLFRKSPFEPHFALHAAGLVGMGAAVILVSAALQSWLRRE